MNLKEIVVLFAMKDEAVPVVEASLCKRIEGVFNEKIPFEVFRRESDRNNLTIVTSGTDSKFGVDNVATQPATLMAYLAIEAFKPDLIISAGTAGGFHSEGCQIGDIYLSSDQICFHDRRIPLPGFDRYGVGHYTPYDTRALASALSIKTGVISTGNSLHHTKRDLDVMRQNGGVVKDMEAAAVAWVCQTLGTPMFAVKAITDLLDRDAETERQFVENMKLAVTNLKNTLVRIFDRFENAPDL